MEAVFRAAGDFTFPQWRIFTVFKYVIIFLFGAILLTLHSWPTKIARFTYTLGFVLLALGLWALRNWGDEWLPVDICIGECFRYAIVYQVSLAFVIYHLLLALFTVGLRNEEPDRAIIHNGLWLFKAIILFGLMVACFFIQEGFFSGFAVVVTIGALLFVLVQVVILLDIAHKLTCFFDQRIQPGSERLWGVAMLVIVFFNFAVAQGVCVVIYYYFGAVPAVVVSNFLFWGFTAASELPGVNHIKKMQNKVYSGVFESSFVAIFVTYLTASAIGSDPALQTNELVWQALFWSGLAGTVVLLCLTSMTSVTGGGWEVLEEKVEYSYSSLHFVFALGGFYVAALLTNWALFGEGGNFESDDFAVGQGVAAYWIKMVMGWSISVLYVLKLVLPTVCQGTVQDVNPTII